MKRIAALAFALVLVIACLPNLSANAALTSADALDGYKNVCLAYTFNASRSDNGRQTVEYLKPYVGYYDNNGKLTDFFFDSYLFLPCVQNGPSGASMHRNSSRPTKALDWTEYVKDTFSDGYNVDALNTAFGNAKKTLGNTDKKAGVFFTILYPTETATDFGTLGGRALNFSKMDDRKYAVKWMIDEQLSLYQNGGYDNLDLVGFYWLEEVLLGTSVGSSEHELINYAADYIHSLGYKFIWIPYYNAKGYNTWKSFGFDVACYQPNLMWQTTPDFSRVKNCIGEATKYGMCMEMEIDNRALSNAEYFKRYLSYLEEGMKLGAMDSIKMYYQGGVPATYYTALHSTNPQAREVYNLTYKYAKGILTADDITAARLNYGDLPRGYNWVSVGKEYTATTAYTVDMNVGYKFIDGKELTDGVTAESDLGTEWHGFHKSVQETSGGYRVTVDLGTTYAGLSFFAAEFENGKEYSIGLPPTVKVSASNTGIDFYELTEYEVEGSGDYVLASTTMKPVQARYLSFEFMGVEGNGNFVFCSEVLIGQTKGKIIVGDSNADGVRNVVDYSICKRIALGSIVADAYGRLNCDLDCDGEVTVVDYSMMKRAVLGTFDLG